MSVWSTSLLLCRFHSSTTYIYEIAYLDLNEMFYQVSLTDLFVNNVIYFYNPFERIPV